MKWRSEYSHPLMLTRDRSDMTAVGLGNGGNGNGFVGNIVDELKDFDEQAMNQKANTDKMLKEMVFAGTSRLSIEEKERNHSMRNSKSNLHLSSSRKDKQSINSSGNKKV
jgi:hypothetical protein